MTARMQQGGSQSSGVCCIIVTPWERGEEGKKRIASKATIRNKQDTVVTTQGRVGGDVTEGNRTCAKTLRAPGAFLDIPRFDLTPF